MSHLTRLFKTADKFQQKYLKYGQSATISQIGTTELFFGDEGKQRMFNSAIQGGIVAKFLTDIATKNQKTTSFDLKASAQPKKGASWILKVVPPNLQNTLLNLLNTEFRKITGKSMAEAQKFADIGAKASGGSGTLDIGSLSVEID